MCRVTYEKARCVESLSATCYAGRRLSKISEANGQICAVPVMNDVSWSAIVLDGNPATCVGAFNTSMCWGKQCHAGIDRDQILYKWAALRGHISTTGKGYKWNPTATEILVTKNLFSTNPSLWNIVTGVTSHTNVNVYDASAVGKRILASLEG